MDIEPGRSVTFAVEAPVLPSAYGVLVNLATVVPPAGTSDPDTSNNTDADIDGVPGTCGFPTHLELTDQSVSATDSFEVCLSLAAGPNFQIVFPGEVTFRAGERIVLKSGFSVLSGGRLTAVTDPVLAASQ